MYKLTGAGGTGDCKTESASTDNDPETFAKNDVVSGNESMGVAPVRVVEALATMVNMPEGVGLGMLESAAGADWVF